MSRETGAIIAAVGTGAGTFGRRRRARKDQAAFIGAAADRFDGLGTDESKAYAQRLRDNPRAAGKEAESFGGMARYFGGMEQRQKTLAATTALGEAGDVGLFTDPKEYLQWATDLVTESKGAIQPGQALSIASQMMSLNQQGRGMKPSWFPSYGPDMTAASYRAAWTNAMANGGTPDAWAAELTTLDYGPRDARLASSGSDKDTPSETIHKLRVRAAKGRAWLKANPDKQLPEHLRMHGWEIELLDARERDITVGKSRFDPGARVNPTDYSGLTHEEAAARVQEEEEDEAQLSKFLQGSNFGIDIPGVEAPEAPVAPGGLEEDLERQTSVFDLPLR